MDFNLNGIAGKLEKNAELLTAIAAIYSRNQEGMGWDYFTNPTGPNGILHGIQYTLTHPEHLKYKLLDSQHLYTGLFKLGVGLMIAGELGAPIVGKYARLGEKIAKTAAIMAIILPGSGGASNGSASKGAQGRIQGY